MSELEDDTDFEILSLCTEDLADNVSEILDNSSDLSPTNKEETCTKLTPDLVAQHIQNIVNKHLLESYTPTTINSLSIDTCCDISQLLKEDGILIRNAGGLERSKVLESANNSSGEDKSIKSALVKNSDRISTIFERSTSPTITTTIENKGCTFSDTQTLESITEDIQDLKTVCSFSETHDIEDKLNDFKKEQPEEQEIIETVFYSTEKRKVIYGDVNNTGAKYRIKEIIRNVDVSDDDRDSNSNEDFTNLSEPESSLSDKKFSSTANILNKEDTDAVDSFPLNNTDAHGQHNVQNTSHSTNLTNYLTDSHQEAKPKLKHSLFDAFPKAFRFNDVICQPPAQVGLYSRHRFRNAAQWYRPETFDNAETLRSVRISHGLVESLRKNRTVRSVLQTAKNSLSNLLVTLDPGMENVLGQIKETLFVITTNEWEAVIFEKAFQKMFTDPTNIRIRIMEDPMLNLPTLPVGFPSGLECAQTKVRFIRERNSCNADDILVAISPVLVEATTKRWHSCYCVLLDDPGRKLSLHVYTQMTPLPNDYVYQAQLRTPSTYYLQHRGLNLSVGQILTILTGVPDHDWEKLLSGVSYYTALENAMETLVGMYQNYVDGWSNNED